MRGGWGKQTFIIIIALQGVRSLAERISYATLVLSLAEGSKLVA